MMQRTIQIEHVTIESKKSFDKVKAALESSVPQLDAGIFVLLQNGEIERARTRLENGPELAIFFSRDHGGLLQIAGQARKALQYDIGNPAHRIEDDAASAPSRALCAAARPAL